MSVKPIIVFTAMGAEYVLSPVALHIRSLGHDILELDMHQVLDPRKALASLKKGRPIILVSSAHPAFNAAGMHQAYNKQQAMLSTLEIMQILQPQASYFIPHDLNHQIHQNEIVHMGLFTAVLAADRSLWWLDQLTRVVDVGWARSIKGRRGLKLDSAENEVPKCIMFLSDFWSLELRGAKAIGEQFRPILECSVPLKLPMWAGVSVFEEALRREGAEVIPAAISSSSLIDEANLVLANALSSTIVESALAGRNVICLMDGIASPERQRQNFYGLRNLHFMLISEAAEWINQLRQGLRILPEPSPARIKPFDFDRAASIILETA